MLVFARTPRPGPVKTRLQPPLDAAQASRLQEALLGDVVARLAAEGYAPRVYFTPDDAAAELEGLRASTGLDPVLTPQGPGDLGERMARALAREAADGAERVVLLGTDSPDLPSGTVAEAFAALDHAHLVLGPSVDGGYCLIGARGVPGPALRGIGWGSGEVLGQTLRAARAAGIGTTLLRPWYDVDRPDDLRFLKTHLDGLLVSAGEDRCPRTRRLLNELLPGPC